MRSGRSPRGSAATNWMHPSSSSRSAVCSRLATPKVLATIEAVERGLLDDRGLVMRYNASDGLGGDEGSFLLCTFWLAEALALADEIDRAVRLIDRALSHANDLGLFSEEVGQDGSLLGNFPQAFSHVGLIHSAYAVGEAQKRAGGRVSE